MSATHQCTGTGNNLCIRFLASLDWSPHPTSCGHVCDMNKACEVCALWNEDRWCKFAKFERGLAVRHSKKKKKSVG